jgi:hypothetical protein
MSGHTVSSLIHTSVADLDSSIRCAVSNGRPIDLATLRDALKTEYASRGRRSSVIKLLSREIKRQEKGGAA